MQETRGLFRINIILTHHRMLFAFIAVDRGGDIILSPPPAIPRSSIAHCSKPPTLPGTQVVSSVFRRCVSVKDWDISRPPVSLCSLMLMKGNHFLHTVKGNRWCHSSAVEFKQSDNLYSRSSSRVKPFLGTSMEGYLGFIYLLLSKILRSCFFPFYN